MSFMTEWRLYKHALLPKCEPHQSTASLADDVCGWSCNDYRGGVIARWTSDFDCEKETDWWYVLKDTPYDISIIKAKRRYEITKGRKNFELIVINPNDYAEDLLEVQERSFEAYPAKYRPKVNAEEFLKSVASWSAICFGAFYCGKDEQGEGKGKLCGYALLTRGERCINFSVLKTIPKFERYALNAALVDGVLTHFNEDLKQGMYICDGERSISHETHFQDYLEKYFGFRKAYSRLNVSYNPRIRWTIPMLYACRSVFRKLDGIGLIHNINAVLKMEEIVRKQK